MSRLHNYPSKMCTSEKQSLLTHKSNTVRNVSGLSTEPWGTPYTAAFRPGSSGSWCRAGEPAVERFPEMSPVDGACWHRHTRTSWPSRSVAGSPFACDSGCQDTLFWCTCRGADAERKESRDRMRLEYTEMELYRLHFRCRKYRGGGQKTRKGISWPDWYLVSLNQCCVEEELKVAMLLILHF